MKRILAALLTLTLTVAFLAACNGGKDPAPTETTPNAQTQPSGSDMSARRQKIRLSRLRVRAVIRAETVLPKT